MCSEYYSGYEKLVCFGFNTQRLKIAGCYLLSIYLSMHITVK